MPNPTETPSKTVQVRYHQDHSHGWLEVPLSEVIRLGFGPKVSSCSYIRDAGRANATVFLEEDCDASLYVDAAKADGITVLPIGVHTDHDSFVRYLPPYYTP